MNRGTLLLLAVSLGFAHAQEPPRLRTLLSHGATLLAENLPNARVVSVQMFASSERVPDTPENHGYKHLLEHLVLKGEKKDLDLRMETQGIFFTGDTLRDAMQIQMTCQPDQIPAALDCLKELLKPVQVTQDDITHEVGIMKQELALQDDASRLAQGAWTIAYGDRGLSPFGDLDVMSHATPQALVEFQSKLFAAQNLVLVVSGPIDIEAVTKEATPILEGVSKQSFEEPEPRPTGNAGRTELDGAFGEARAARVPGFQDPRTAWALAAALAVAARNGPTFVTYTPSADNGLVIVGKTDATSGLGLMIDSLDAGDKAALFPLGKALATRWVERQLQDPVLSASIRGILLCQGASYRPEDMLANIKSMTWEKFFLGLDMFSKTQADIAVGIR